MNNIKPIKKKRVWKDTYKDKQHKKNKKEYAMNNIHKRNDIETR